MPDGTFFAIVHHPDGDKSPFSEKRIGIDHASFNIPAEDLPAWERHLCHAGISYQPPAPSASGELLIGLRDPDNIQIQIYGRNAE